MRTTEMLKEEHRMIERMLRVLEAVSGELDRGGDVPSKVIGEIIDFIRTFADQCHHAKEEDLLFTRAELRGLPRHGGPIGVMLDEHELGRRNVREMAEALTEYDKGGEGARSTIARNTTGYAQLLSQHILKEDSILYPMIDNILTEDDESELTEKFEQVEHERIGEGRHHSYIELVERLEGEYLKS
jgi:hemerythrin-like domain-containing protein